MAEQVQGVPADVTEEVQGVPSGLIAETLSSPKQSVQGVPEGLTAERLAPNKALVAPKTVSTVAKTTAPAQVSTKTPTPTPVPEESLLTQMDKSPVTNPQQALAIKAARGVRGLYHGVMGDEENNESKGETTTASPEAANLGFTPEHVGYESGSMLHGIGKFAKEGIQDLAGKTPVAIPDTVAGKPNASFWDRVKGMGDPEAHTMMAKYITAPSMQEREASEKEMEQYFQTHGAAAGGHAISAFLHGTLGEYVPAIGPLAMAITDKAQKGDIGGALAQIASLYAFEKSTGALKNGIKDRVNAKTAELVKSPEVKQAETNVEATKKPLEDAQAKHAAAAAEHAKYSASHAQGIESPKAVRSALDKAQAELDEAQAHHDLAKEHLAKTQAAQPTIPQQVGGAVGRVAAKLLPTSKEVPAEQVEALPTLNKIGAPESAKPVATPINVKTPGQVQPETFPQTPTERPRTPFGRIELANNQGTMGKAPLLTEGTPIGPKVPEGGLPKIKMPEIEAPKPEVATAADLRSLKAKEGKVIDTNDNVEGRIHKLLQEALKPEAPKTEAPKAESPTEHRAAERRTEEVPVENDRRQGERRVLKGLNEKAFQESAFGGGEKRIDTDAYARAMEQARKELGPDASVKDVIKRRDEIVSPEAKGKTEDIGAQAREANPEPTRAETKAPVLPKEEPTGYEAKKEEVVPAGAEGREPAKSAAEYHPAVEQKVNELSDENLRKLAQAHGLNPDEYDFKARDERRHRVERDQLAKDITAQLGEDEKINLGRAAEATEKQGTFAGADVSAKGRAERAAKMFPRIRGPVDDFGNPKVSGGAPETKSIKSSDIPERESSSDAVLMEDTHADGRPLTWKRLDLSPQEVAKRTGFYVRDAANSYATPSIVKSVGKSGIRNPLVLFKNYLEGNHRLAAALSLDLKTVPVYEGSEGTVGTAEAAKSDTEHFANAKKELGDKASISDVAKRAQELKDAHAQVAEHEKNGGSTFSPKGKDLNGTDKYSVGAYPDRTEQVDKLTPERLEEFKKKNSDVLSKEDHAVGTWKDPDTGKAVLDVTKLYGNKDEAIAAGKAANQKAIFHLGGDGEIQTGGTGLVNEKGSPIDEFGNPTVSGGAPEKKLPTGDALIKKYGESSGDPKDLTFILKDGRGVANTGIEHDHMLGGRTDEKVPPRERFIAEGNIRVRPRQGAGGREVALSIPESGVTSDQLKYIQKMSPQLRSGAVMIEVGKPGGGYKAIPYGEASPEQLETTIRGLGPVLNEKGSPIDWNGNPTVSGGSPTAGTAPAKVKPLPKLAEEHLTEEEKAGVTKTEAGRQRFVDNLKKLPSLQEFTDIAKAGEGGRKWYQRSAAAFDALTEEAPKYFKEGDRQKFTDFLAALSPQQSVKMNLGEALNTWTRYVDEGRPAGKELEKLLKDELTLSGAKIPNATKALAGEPLWPDLSKNSNFKVPSFAKNLNGYLNHVTNDGWQALFGGLDAKEISKANSYHPLAVVTRAAADALGWEPAEAQAAIWAFTKTFTEKGETLPEDVRRRSEDFADILALDPEIRQQLKQLGVNHEQLDAKLRAIGKKPAITSGASPSSEGSIRKLAARIEKARGAGTIPPPKSGNLNFDEDEETRFEPKDFANEETNLDRIGKKKSTYGKLK